MQIAVNSWWPLWLLAAAPLLWLASRPNRAAISRRRIRVAGWLRACALCLLIAALTAPTLRTRTHQVSVVYALDISRSVSPEFLRGALQWMRAANTRYRPAQTCYLVFADHAELLADLESIPSVPVRSADKNPHEDGAIDQNATDLEQALTTALLGFAPGHAKRLVLMSDGNQTAGDVWRALPRLQAERVRVFAVPATVALEGEVWIDELILPQSVRQLEPVTLRLRVFSRGRLRATVQLAVAGAMVGNRVVSLSPGENELIFSARFKHAGENAVVAKLALEGGPVSRDDSLTETVWVQPRPRVLYVESSPGAARYLANALTLQGIEVATATPEQFAGDPRALQGMDAVILSDVPPDRLGPASVRRLEVFVRDLGGGLIFSAGENAYGRQGYAKGEVERLLPVRFEARRKRRELDLVLLIDRSYSMRGRKLELAKSAALATLDLLEEQHRLAVIAFDSKAHDVVPLTEVGSKRRADALISSMTSSGQTNIYNALTRAYELLAASKAKTKHVILLSDGVTAPPPGALGAGAPMSDSDSAWKIIRELRKDTLGRPLLPQEPAEAMPASGGFEDLVARMAAADITLSTVAIGDKPNLELMSALARWGNGKGYVAARDVELPGMFVAEARRLLGESLVEEPFRPLVKAKGEALAGVDFGAGPPLRGYVRANAKRFSDVLLEAKNGEPLLVQTRYGLGKTVAFLSDLKNRWAVEWLSWPGYARFWAQVVRDAIRDSADQGLAWRVSRRGPEALITLSALDGDGAYRNGLSPKVRVVTPDAQSNVMVLRQVAPGTYRASMPLQAFRQSAYRFELLPSPGISRQETTQAGARSLFYPRSDEFRALPPNVALLEALSRQTGGKLAPKAEEVLAPSSDAAVASAPLWPYLAAAALLLFLADIAARRVPWARLDRA